MTLSLGANAIQRMPPSGVHDLCLSFLLIEYDLLIVLAAHMAVATSPKTLQMRLCIEPIGFQSQLWVQLTLRVTNPDYRNRNA